jgi:O-antigen ligase
MNPVPSTATPTPSAARLTRRLELATLIHLGLFVVIASWGFGGNASWSRQVLTWWGSLGGAILLTALSSRTMRTAGQLRPLRWLWPLALLNAVVLASLFNPSLRVITMDHEELLAKTASLPNLPSSALPPLSLGSLWLFDGLYLSSFNLALLVRRRRALRGLLLVAGANALLLAIFGSVQKLVHAPGLYFGLVKSPQSYFFASFIYHNHWGAFTVLMTAVCLGLVAHYARNGADHDFWHSPAFGGLVTVFFLAASIPLSTSRSCTLLVLALLGGAFLHWVVHTVRRRRERHQSAVRPLLGALVILLAAGGAAYKLAEPIIEQRLAKTREQIGQLRARGDFGGRQQLYRDTWHMARDKLWFGWGMASYPTIFYYYYNTQDSPVDRLPVFYYDAHSDWLQSLAELGVVGTALIGLCGLVPLLSLRRYRAPGPLPRYLFAGCALVLFYAWVEFPFGNPAVVLAWWLCFFAGVRYVRLDAHAADS